MNLPALVHLSPRGDFPHAHGLQRIDDRALQSLVKQFNSFRGQFSRAFRGLPIYIGHPDSPELAHAYPDSTVYGRITRLRTDPAGLFGEVQWSGEATTLAKAAPFRFLSPFWEAEEVGVELGRPVLQPLRLISAGLTNKPNLPVLAFAPDPVASPATVRKILENALRDGRITPAQVPGWTLQLANDLSLTERTIQLLPTVIHTRSVTTDFGKRRLDLGNPAFRSRQLTQLMAPLLQAGLTYDEAWAKVKQSHPALFAEMQEPAA